MRRFPLCPVCKPCLAPAPLFLQIGGRFPAVHKGVSMSRHESVHPEHAGFSHNLLVFDNLERATKIILGLATICKLARNNQELASGGSSEDQPLALITMENLFNL